MSAALASARRCWTAPTLRGWQQPVRRTLVLRTFEVDVLRVEELSATRSSPVFIVSSASRRSRHWTVANVAQSRKLCAHRRLQAPEEQRIAHAFRLKAADAQPQCPFLPSVPMCDSCRQASLGKHDLGCAALEATTAARVAAWDALAASLSSLTARLSWQAAAATAAAGAREPWPLTAARATAAEA